MQAALEQPDALTLKPILSKYIRTPEKVLLWRTGSGGEWRVLYRSPTEEVYPFSCPFDIRAVGLLMMGDLASTRFLDFEDFKQVVRNEKALAHSVEGRIHRIELRHGKHNNSRRIVWIDESRQFVPIKMEVWLDADTGQHLRLNSEVSWEERGDVFVPTSYAIRENQIGGGYKEYNLAIDWRVVNQPVDANVFTLEGLELDPLTTVVETRLGDDKPIVLGVTGQVAPGESPFKANPGPRLILIGVNVVVAVLLLIVIFLRRRRAKYAT